MYRFFLLTIIFFIIVHSSKSQDNYSITFYNVENLFDIVDDPHKNDNDFLPESKKLWDKRKYRKKLIQLSKAILVSSNFEPPTLLGVAEIENEIVLNDLLKKTPLRKFKLKIIHFNSTDKRGIDVALFYDPKKCQIIESKAFQLFKENGNLFQTRDILYTSCLINQDTFHIAVNHWPSRMGGVEKSNPKRLIASKRLRSIIDSIGPNKNWILMGDFNDEPHNKSMANLRGKNMENLMSVIEEGSYFYRNNWYKYDQFLISKAFKETWIVDEVRIINNDWLLVHNQKKLISYPFRTYQGPKYIGGFSDHLPININIHKK